MVWFRARGGARIGLPPVTGRFAVAEQSRALRHGAETAGNATSADGNRTNKQRTRARTYCSGPARYNVSRKTHSQVT
jgi:hypothetical protein